MTTFHSRQSDCGRRVQKMANAATFNFTPPNLHSHVHEARKIWCNHFQRALQEHVNEWSFYTREALPLVWTRFFRLAHISPMIARSPVRWSRDGRDSSGKKSGEMSRVIFAQRPGNGRAVAAAMSLNVLQDDSQDNWPCAGIRRAMSAPETYETTRNTIAQQPCRSLHNGQCNISRAACRILVIGF